MTKKYSIKKSLISSVLSLALCISMLIGTTFAWFTDQVTSENNIIQAGDLDVEMYWAEGKDDPSNATWQDASQGAIFNNDKWEPGYTEVRHIKIENKGSLALQYKIIIVANGEVTNLADVIDVYYLDPAAQITDRSQLNSDNKLGTLSDVLANLEESATGYLSNGASDTITLALKMQESAGNEYKNVALCEGGFSVQLLATQAMGESDSFGDDYDKNAAADFFPGFQGGSADISVTTDDQRYTTTEVTIECGDIIAVIPAGVKLAEGYSSLQLSVALKNSSDSNVQLSENEKMRPSDVHIEGVASDNTTPMFITLKHYLTTGVNAGALKLYHIENGVTVPMTYAVSPTNHNEFTHDPLTGDLTVALASFSEVAVVADTNNPWDGTTEIAYTGSGTEADPYLIASADQLAYFRTQVDNGNSFDGKFVKLNNNIYLSGKDFDPIGWGYVDTQWNRDGVAGKVFQGTFDGNGKTIFDLHQSGWDLEEKTGTDYTYTNCGFGLFAAASNATFKNLTISGAYVRVECVEAGILVGLSQNDCIYQNIEIHNSKIANYQRPAGGLIGEVSGDGTTTITNVTIGSDVVVGSLWGDFDAPCGGVIGARWDDVGANPQIEMSNVEVGCRMDVYSDVTSAYQWYAYRRAGMLIGNTELSDPDNKHLAYAKSFLKCENVKVYYGDWAAYHYCQFTNQDNSWCNNYPWVRVEAGENCSPYSNPRYGQPVINGVAVSTDKHTCTGEHLMERRFNQLYGGGQGVYGQFEHEGVEVINYRYSITYVNDYEVLAIKYITEDGAVKTANDVAANLVVDWANKNIGEGKFAFGGWMNAGSTKVETISADNDHNIVLYPYFNKPYTARFVDQQGNVVAWCLFHAEDLKKLDVAKATAEAALPNPGELFVLDYWEVNANGSKVQYNENNFKNYTYDVTIYPVYRYTGNLKLTPVDEDSDGTIDYYKVEAVDVLDETTVIPGYVNGVPVTLVEKLYKNDNNWDFGSGVKTIIIEEGVEELAHNSLGYTADLTTVKLPSTLKKLNKNAFSRNTGDDKKVLTIEFNGTKAEWDKIVASSDKHWTGGLLVGTTVVCSDGTYTLTKTSSPGVIGLGERVASWEWSSKT